MNALKTEIDRIADSSNFNGIKLLDGSLAAEGGSAASSVGKIEGIGLLDVEATKGTFTSLNDIAAAGKAAVGVRLALLSARPTPMARPPRRSPLS